MLCYVLVIIIIMNLFFDSNRDFFIFESFYSTLAESYDVID